MRIDPNTRDYLAPRLLKVGLLLLLLLGPMIFYMGLKLVGKNHYTLPIYFQNPPEYPYINSSSIECPAHRHPYRVFEHASGAQFFKDNTQIYLIHFTHSAEEIKKIQIIFNKIKEKSLIQFYSLTEIGKTLPIPAGESYWQRKVLSPKGITYLRDCVLHVGDLFTEKLPQSWALLLDQKGQIRGFFDPSNKEDFSKGFGEALILQKETQAASFAYFKRP